MDGVEEDPSRGRRACTNRRRRYFFFEAIRLSLFSFALNFRVGLSDGGSHPYGCVLGSDSPHLLYLLLISAPPGLLCATEGLLRPGEGDPHRRTSQSGDDRRRLQRREGHGGQA